MSAQPPARLLLASTSPYRRELLGRLKLPFDTVAPKVDETPLPGEEPTALALRLAQSKARAPAGAWPGRLIIGSDQVAVAGSEILGKPGTHARAVHQLALMRGKTIRFHTALCLHNSESGREQSEIVTVSVAMRTYSDAEVERYVRAERPFDCAGSARIEGLGISLVEKLDGDDPTALIGLPLIALCRMLRNEGIELP